MNREMSAEYPIDDPKFNRPETPQPKSEESDTPKTDAFAESVHEGVCLSTCDSFDHDEKCPVVFGERLIADFARQLERELIALQVLIDIVQPGKHCDNLRGEINNAQSRIAELEEEKESILETLANICTALNLDTVAAQKTEGTPSGVILGYITELQQQNARLREALENINRTVVTNQNCSKGNESIAVWAMDALADSTPVEPMVKSKSQIIYAGCGRCGWGGCSDFYVHMVCPDCGGTLAMKGDSCQ